MDRTRIVIGLLLLLLVSPVIGIIIPWLHYFIPIAIAFSMPVDSPPFSEILMPLFASFSILIGITGFSIYLFSRGRKVFMLKAYASVFVFYSSFALLIWLLFFGARFLKHFLIKDIGFYVLWASYVVPHIVWIALLIWCIRALKSLTNKNNRFGDNQPASPDAHTAAPP